MLVPMFLWRRWDDLGRIPRWAFLLWPTLHFCNDFDGLLVQSGMMEFECCACFKE